MSLTCFQKNQIVPSSKPLVFIFFIRRFHKIKKIQVAFRRRRKNAEFETFGVYFFYSSFSQDKKMPSSKPLVFIFFIRCFQFPKKNPQKTPKIQYDSYFLIMKFMNSFCKPENLIYCKERYSSFKRLSTRQISNILTLRFGSTTDFTSIKMSFANIGRIIKESP